MKIIDNVSKFFHEVRLEMTKVTWPTRRELLNSTMVVMIAIVFLAVFIGIEDKVLSLIIEKIVVK